MNLSTIFLQAGDQGISTMLMLGGMILVFYFFMIRPQMRRQKQEKKYREELKRGDWVVTTSGIHGKIFELNADTVVLETGAGKVKFERSAISKELSTARYASGTEKKD